MLWKIDIKYLILIILATGQLGFASSKKTDESKTLTSKGDGYEFKYTKDWDLSELDDGGAILYSKIKKSFFISVTILPKRPITMENYLKGERLENRKKRFVFGEMTKIDGRTAALILKVDPENEKEVNSEHNQSLNWSVTFFCASKIFGVGYAGHLNKDEREEARKQRTPPKEFQDFLDGFKCLQD